MVVFDTLGRYFLHLGYNVKFVQNFTDVDDKIINLAKEQNTTREAVAHIFTEEAKKIMHALNISMPTSTPKVTESMPHIIEMIEVLIKKGHAYEAEGDIYFDTSTCDYGVLKTITNDTVSRIEKNPRKKNPCDFVLWKGQPSKEFAFDSPWGYGRPGWHIECSAIVKKHLGDTIDIHGGGKDLLFPHHENEWVQSKCANGVPLAGFFMHNGFINIDDEKMGKSTGEFFLLKDIAEEYDWEVIRFFLLSSHYRSDINFTIELMESAQTAYNRILNCMSRLLFLLEQTSGQPGQREIENLNKQSFGRRFFEALGDDFNTALALGVVFELVKFANTYLDEDCSRGLILAVRLLFLEFWIVLGFNLSKKSDLAQDVEKLIEEREIARKRKDFVLADKIRDRLFAKGITLEDTRSGVRWKFNE